MMKKTLCELFAGVGGFRVGLEANDSGWETVWANQREPSRTAQYAFDCYAENFGGKQEKYSNVDIAKVNKKDIPDHNLLVGGFPCQDYSVARTGAKGIQGKKGVLWRQIRDILIAKKPSFVLLENVDRLLKSPGNQRGRDFGIILASFNELGYSVEWRVINAADYGRVQRRRRTFIFAYKNTTKYGKSLNGKTFEDLLHKDGFFINQFGVEDSPLVKRNTELEYNDLADISDKFKFDFGNAGIMRNGKIYTEEIVPHYEGPKMNLGDIIQDSVDEKYKIKQDISKWKYLKGPKRIVRKQGTPQEYVFSEGGIAFPDPLDRPARTMLTSEGSLNRSTHVVQDKNGDYRILTPIETERINGFPDDWTSKGGMPEKFRYFCMGNALCVPMITKMGKVLDDIFEKED